jgi:predicted O-linked N-acetylglucosamine transferase (SPINDLY family)
VATISAALEIALQHHRTGCLVEAQEIYQRILAVEPENACACNGLGVILRLRGQLETAADCFQRAVRAQPELAEAHNSLGNVWRQLGRFEQSIASYRRVLELSPGSAVAHNNLAVVFEAMGRREEAAACYRRALEIDPDYAEAWSNFGGTLTAQGRVPEAIDCFRRAIDLNPAIAAAHNNLGNLLQAQGRLDDAVLSYRRALALAHDFAAAHNNLGLTLRELARLDAAELSHRRALEIDPGFAEAHANLAGDLLDQGRLDEAISSCRRATELKPQTPQFLDSLLAALSYHPAAAPASLAAAHEEYQRCHAAPLANAWRPHANSRDGSRKLRLGFVSPDFARHPVGYFLLRALENLDRAQCDTVCYSDRVVGDELTATFQSLPGVWRESRALSDDELAAQIRNDQIDILFDLAGHTANNRLLVFARKPAPVAITWIGYEGTTGLKAIDYLLADRHLVPVESEPYYAEQVLRMPDSYVCFTPFKSPPVSPLPALSARRVAFGCFNTPAKINGRVIAVWSHILQRVPDARLILKYRGLDIPSVRSRLAGQFATEGVSVDRVELVGASPYEEYLRAYDCIDIALDPFPFGGGATTCETLWMGVPVVTWPGQPFASRHGLSYLSSLGLTETIARDGEEYVQIAVDLAQDLPRLAKLRAELRERMAASPLCDGKRFAANLMALLRNVWRDWCSRSGAN